MRILFLLLVLGGLLGGGYFYRDKLPQWKGVIEEKLNSGEYVSFKTKVSAEEIMEKNKKTLLKNESYHYLEPKMAFYPYLLMDVKYAFDHKTEEGSLLWGLNDGEMVIDATSWEKTHGFEDCIQAHANKEDLKIIRAIVDAGGAIDREKLYDHFNAENELVNKWLESVLKKKLVASSGGKFRLHLQNPLLKTKPMTLLDESLVNKPKAQAKKMTRKYSQTEIKSFALLLFGNDFLIRKSQEVYLPVWVLTVENPDGSTLTTYWNGLNGKRMDENLREI